MNVVVNINFEPKIDQTRNDKQIDYIDVVCMGTIFELNVIML